MWNLNKKKDTNELIYKTETESQREQIYGNGGGWGEEQLGSLGWTGTYCCIQNGQPIRTYSIAQLYILLCVCMNPSLPIYPSPPFSPHPQQLSFFFSYIYDSILFFSRSLILLAVTCGFFYLFLYMVCGKEWFQRREGERDRQRQIQRERGERELNMLNVVVSAYEFITEQVNTCVQIKLSNFRPLVSNLISKGMIIQT